MDNYCLQLLNAINNYDGSEKSTNKICQLICYISESALIEKTEDVYEILYEASDLIRVFGYNYLNKINASRLHNNNDLALIKSRLVHNYYRAQSDDKALLDKKQKEIIDYYQSLDFHRIFVSAPTSFGKTHILKEILFINKEKYNKIVLIFPTIALLTENMDSISNFVEQYNLGYRVTNTFQDNIATDERTIYILTPERAIMIFDLKPKVEIDFFFFDEVYKIDEDFNSSDDYDETLEPIGQNNNKIIKYSRAVAFRIVLYFLAQYSKDFYIAGPYIDLTQLKPGMELFIKRYNVTKIHIETEATLKTFFKAWDKNIVSFNDIEGSKAHTLIGQYKNVRDKIKALYNYISENCWGQTLVYCDTSNRATNYAQYVANANATNNSEIIELLDHLKHRYSVKRIQHNNIDSYKDWSLIRLLEGETGVHHGKLPKYIQKEMLRLFNQGTLPILFCTSTLIEGVNTSAKNIIIASSNIRQTSKLNQFDIKNIIGRAGRYYHHFLGRVFLIREDQDQILNGESQQLNFALFDAAPLAAEDIDNISQEYLDESWQPYKEQRDMQLNKALLPDEVFVKNRLFDRLLQENLLKILDKNFNYYQHVFRQSFAIDTLSDENLSAMLHALQLADIISISQENGHKWITTNFKHNGIKGLIDYEMNINKDFTSVDSAYSNAFNKTKTVIEYKMPRYLTLLQALYNFACIKRGKEDLQVDLTNLTKFFETGVVSPVGQYLVEHGMPTAIMRSIEKGALKNITTLTLEEGLAELSNNKKELVKHMDAFEYRVFNRLVL